MLGNDPPPSVQAVVLAAGHGSRMPPLVSTKSPKALLTISNRPMLFYTLFSLYRASITNVAVVVERHFREDISHYVDNEFPDDPAVVALGFHPLSINVHERATDAGTADALREIDLTANDVLVLSCDTITDAPLDSFIYAHRNANAVCTVAIVSTDVEIGSMDDAQTIKNESNSGKQSKGVKGNKVSKAPKLLKSPGSTSRADIFALLSAENRLLNMLHPVDLSSSTLPIPANLIQRYGRLSVRTDIYDVHMYVFHTSTLQHVLKHCPAATSIKYDVVPYMARRQHTLARVANQHRWPLPADSFIVAADVWNSSIFARRANTVDTFRDANFDVAGGKIAHWLGEIEPASGKKGKKGDGKKSLLAMFASAGDKASVTPDSVIGTGVSVGARTSVKKSIVGDKCSMGDNVKINGCVILEGVTLENGVNLSGCVVCEKATVCKNSILKDCHIARKGRVRECTEAASRDFGNEAHESMNLGDEFGADLEFY